MSIKQVVTPAQMDLECDEQVAVYALYMLSTLRRRPGTRTLAANTSSSSMPPSLKERMGIVPTAGIPIPPLFELYSIGPDPLPSDA